MEECTFLTKINVPTPNQNSETEVRGEHSYSTLNSSMCDISSGSSEESLPNSPSSSLQDGKISFYGFQERYFIT